MPEQTTPETAVAPTPDLEAALESSFNFAPEPKKVAVPEPAEQEPEQETPADQDGELTPDDLPEVEAPEQSADDAFEIVHNGKQVKLSREELIRNAQQGFDYTQKTQALADQQRQVTQRLQRLEQVEQLQNALAPDLAQVKAVEAQLKQYEKVDWVQLATDNPLEYPKYRAQYDTLQQAYRSVVGQYQQKASALEQQKQTVTAEVVAQQRNLLLEKLPEWKDEAKYRQGAQQVRDYLISEGVPADRLDNLNDATSIAIAVKAMRYDQLQKAKAAKVNLVRTAPPVVKPGAVSQQPDGKTQFNKFRQSFRAAGTKGQSRTQESLLLDKLNRTFK